MTGRRAQAGGELIGGRSFKGGQFIPEHLLSGDTGASAVLSIDGVEELMKTLDGIGEALEKRGEKQMLAAAGQVIAREQRKQVPQAKTPGHNNKTVRKRIGSRVVRTTEGHTVKAGVGVGKKQIKKGESGGWGNVLAAGSKDRHTQSGHGTGRVIKDEFVRRGFNNAVPKVIDEMAKRGSRFFDRETKKLERRNRVKGGIL